MSERAAHGISGDGEGRVASRPGPARFRPPREYGAWAMVIGPFLLGLVAAGRLTWAVPLLGVALAGMFVARYPLTAWRRARRAGTPWRALPPGLLEWLAGSVAAGTAGGVGLLLVVREAWPVGLGLAASLPLAGEVVLAVRGQRRSWGGQLMAVAGGALAAPGAYLAAGGPELTAAAGLWVLSLLHWGAGVSYVRMKVEELAVTAGQGWQKRWKGGRWAVLHVGGGGLLVAWMAWAGYLPWAAPVAMLPLLAQVVVDIVRPSPVREIRRLGRRMVAHSVIFLLVVGLAYRL